MQGLLAFVLLLTAGGSKPKLRIPSYTESGIAITSIALTRDAGPWNWAPRVDNAACGVQMIGVYNYLTLPNLRLGSDEVTLVGVHPSKATEFFRDVRCSMRTAWQLADDKFGKDHETCSFAVACVVDLEHEIGPTNYRLVHETGRVCRVLASEDVHLHVLIQGNVTAASKGAKTYKKVTTVQFLSHIRSSSSSSSSSSSPSTIIGRESSEFVVCGVQSFRNVLSPFILPMWVHHYTTLGYRVALFDRYGLHSEVISRYFPLTPGASAASGMLDYFPHTMLDKALHRNTTKDSQRDFSYKVYYKEHLSAAKGVAPKVTLERNTGLLDREKVVTYDHCRLLYSKARGVLYVDTDEFLYCPAVRNTYAEQSAHQLGTLHRLADEGVDEIRMDTYPYDTSSTLASADVSALQKCLQNAAASATSSTPKSVAPPTAFSYMHACMSSRSTYPTWMKSADLGRRCPFHYNHWSCDGGKGGGRNTQCRCRVSIGPWMALTSHAAHTDACHLMHYNPQQYAYQTGRNRRGAKNKTEYDESLRIKVKDSKLASITLL